jgi:2,3-bisphosphoglycerate-independent phosphoglycerate mutase
VRVPRVTYAGMLQYDGDLKLPKRFLVDPPAILDTMGEWFAKAGITQFACSETQKFGHVTYFWNGNRSNKFDGETYQEVPSDVVPFEQRPWMKAAEIADAMIEALKSGQYRTLRCNFANGDMVGHTGSFRAATMAIEAVDLELARILPVIDALGGVALITADHGNADEMYEIDKKSQTTGDRMPDGSFKAKTCAHRSIRCRSSSTITVSWRQAGSQAEIRQPIMVSNPIARFDQDHAALSSFSRCGRTEPRFSRRASVRAAIP